MEQLVDLGRYPLHLPDSPHYEALVQRCKVDIAGDGMFNLTGFLFPEAALAIARELKPAFDTEAFTHSRAHNIYFLDSVPGVSADHPALRKFQTVNRTLCGNQVARNPITRVYEWQALADFLAAVMGRRKLHTMADPLARINVMAYHEGEALNWHFDRSEFTTTLLLQAPIEGGEFEYRRNLRSDDNPNFSGVAKLIDGEDDQVRRITLAPGTLNVFCGKNTAHRVTPVRGS